MIYPLGIVRIVRIVNVSIFHQRGGLHGRINPVNKVEKAWHTVKQSAVEVEKVSALYAGTR